jgi:hypothetical protein
MKKIALGIALAAALIVPAAVALAGGNGSPEANSSSPFTMAVYGDAPYGTNPTDHAELDATPAFIRSINSDPQVREVMHVGDIHSGQQYCTEPYDQSIYDLWATFKDPLVYTPGDNEWTDCHKANEGGGAYSTSTGQIVPTTDSSGNNPDYAGGDPLANLALIRSIFFPQPGLTLGGQKMQVISQAQVYDSAHPTDAQYVENVMWEQSQVLFVTVNLPGGSNNDKDTWYGTPFQTPGQAQEGPQRTGADIRWLDAAFAKAKADGMKAVVIGTQADMWDPEKGAAHQAGYEPVVSDIASNSNSFGKPVMLFNGDSHVYRSDNPFDPSDPVNAMHPSQPLVPDFHRIVVHGSTFPLEWLKLSIDPAADHPTTDTSFGPFSWQRMIQQ